MSEADDVAQGLGAESGASDAQSGTGRIPPYIPFPTLLTFLQELKSNGLPPQIDGSVLRRFSGGTQSQLKMAVRALGLMEGTKPTPQLQALVDAYDTPAFEPLLLEILKATYPYVFALDLMTATPQMFADAFKSTGAKEDVSRKCRTFFLHAAKRAGVPMGNRILTGSVPRSPSNGSSRKKAKVKPKEDFQEVEVERQPPPPAPMSDKALEYKLVDLLKEPDLGEDERPAIWTLIQYLARREKNKATDQK
jgi:hypothetical protein